MTGVDLWVMYQGKVNLVQSKTVKRGDIDIFFGQRSNWHVGRFRLVVAYF